nr:MAG TPA: hypothetical protein [Caudoviricetes sp.]DAO49033.1 MAG TPA: hypothetical protein [Caudoviricetes sp.]DAP74607.1 MAG TPA: hypothetical protein [Caudoviricetes sp.]
MRRFRACRLRCIVVVYVAENYTDKISLVKRRILM